jgi:hypothetical protein
MSRLIQIGRRSDSRQIPSSYLLKEPDKEADMPLPVENITKETPLAQVRRLIAETIRKLIDDEGKDPKAAAGQAYGMAQDKWGRSIPRGG